MKKFKRLIATALAVVMILSLLPISAFATQTKADKFVKVTLSGNSAKDIVEVAKAQVGKTQSQYGYTEAWCADFVCDCAKVANISDKIIPHNYASRGGCVYLYKEMVNNCNAKVVTSPQAGDFVFYYCSIDGGYCHVGIMIDSTYYVSGNMWTSGSSKVEKQKAIGGYYDGHGSNAGCISRTFVRPNYGSSSTTTPTQYTITYNANGGTGAPAKQSKPKGSYVTVPSTVPTRPGYKFVGWATTATNQTLYVTPGRQIWWDGNQTLYAMWEANTLTVNYKTNGGTIDSTIYKDINGSVGKISTNAVATFTYPSGSNTINDPLSPTGLYDAGTFGLSRQGYKFVGWGTTASGGTIFDQKDSTLTPVNITSNIKNGDCTVTLYAIWASNTITVSYKTNGGVIDSTTYKDVGGYVGKLSTGAKATWIYPSPSGPSTIYDPLGVNGLYDAKTFGLSRPGYTFVGWGTTATGGTVYDQYDGTVTPYQLNPAVKNKDSSIELYAIWKINDYIISYSPNGGIGAPSNQTKISGADLTLSSDIPTKENYKFLGWSLDYNAKTPTWKAGDVYSNDSSATLYAVWEKSAYTIEYNANGGYSAPEKQSVNIGSSLTISSESPIKWDSADGFLGWSTDKNASEPEYKAGDVMTPTGDMTLYAVWQSPTELSLGVINNVKLAPNEEKYFTFTPSETGFYRVNVVYETEPDYGEYYDRISVSTNIYDGYSYWDYEASSEFIKMESGTTYYIRCMTGSSSVLSYGVVINKENLNITNMTATATRTADERDDGEYNYTSFLPKFKLLNNTDVIFEGDIDELHVFLGTNIYLSPIYEVDTFGNEIPWGIGKHSYSCFIYGTDITCQLDVEITESPVESIELIDGYDFDVVLLQNGSFGYVGNGLSRDTRMKINYKDGISKIVNLDFVDGYHYGYDGYIAEEKYDFPNVPGEISVTITYRGCSTIEKGTAMQHPVKNVSLSDKNQSKSITLGELDLIGSVGDFLYAHPVYLDIEYVDGTSETILFPGEKPKCYTECSDLRLLNWCDLSYELSYPDFGKIGSDSYIVFKIGEAYSEKYQIEVVEDKNAIADIEVISFPEHEAIQGTYYDVLGTVLKFTSKGGETQTVTLNHDCYKSARRLNINVFGHEYEASIDSYIAEASENITINMDVSNNENKSILLGTVVAEKWLEDIVVESFSSARSGLGMKLKLSYNDGTMDVGTISDVIDSKPGYIPEYCCISTSNGDLITSYQYGYLHYFAGSTDSINTDMYQEIFDTTYRFVFYNDKGKFQERLFYTDKNEELIKANVVASCFGRDILYNGSSNNENQRSIELSSYILSDERVSLNAIGITNAPISFPDYFDANLAEGYIESIFGTLNIDITNSSFYEDENKYIDYPIMYFENDISNSGGFAQKALSYNSYGDTISLYKETNDYAVYKFFGNDDEGQYISYVKIDRNTGYVTYVGPDDPVVIEPCKHESITLVNKVDVTCTSDGYTGDKVCDDCGETVEYGSVIECSGQHDYKATVTAATENSQGYTTHTCAKCGDSYKDNFVDYVPKDAPVIDVSGVKCVPGSTVNVTVNIKNNPGIVGAILQVEYNSRYLTLVGVQDGGILGTEMHPDSYDNAGGYTLCWMNDTATENFTTNGTLVTLSFKVAEDTPVGDYEIGISYDNDYDQIIDKDLHTVDFAVVGGYITVNGYMIGDITGDAKITQTDRIILSRYLAGWAGYEDKINLEAADVNGDGKLTSVDRMILSRYLAGWGGEYDKNFE